jgi:cyclophilin family peptidyl-prolyl cis-trans isomerase
VVVERFLDDHVDGAARRNTTEMTKADRRARKRQNQALAAQQRQAVAQRQRRKRNIQWGAIAAVAVVVVVAVVYFVGGNNKGKASTTTTTEAAPSTTAAPTSTTLPVKASAAVCAEAAKVTTPTPHSYPAAPPFCIDMTKTYTATIVTNEGTMTATLAAKDSPVATNNFVFLAQHHFYDGLKWHRVVKDFVIQGGDPKGDGSGGPGYSVKGEVPKSGKYQLGALAAAKTGTDPDGTMGSQFFIVTGSQGESLPPQYAYFGVVTKGIDVAQKIGSFSNGDGPPTKPMSINSITIAES